jgi:hypothetical protein
MRKITVLIVMFFTVLLLLACDPEPMDIPVPENVFVNTVWECLISTTDGKEGNIDLITLSFTENTFTFHHRKDRIQKDESFTGTYRLFYIERTDLGGFFPLYDPAIEFISDNPELNGTVHFSVAPPAIIHGIEDGALLFSYSFGSTGNVSLVLYPIIPFIKIN